MQATQPRRGCVSLPLLPARLLWLPSTTRNDPPTSLPYASSLQQPSQVIEASSLSTSALSSTVRLASFNRANLRLFSPDIMLQEASTAEEGPYESVSDIEDLEGPTSWLFTLAVPLAELEIALCKRLAPLVKAKVPKASRRFQDSVGRFLLWLDQLELQRSEPISGDMDTDMVILRYLDAIGSALLRGPLLRPRLVLPSKTD